MKVLKIKTLIRIQLKGEGFLDEFNKEFEERGILNENIDFIFFNIGMDFRLYIKLSIRF